MSGAGPLGPVEPSGFGRAGKSQLAPGFEDGHCHGIGQVQTAVARLHGQAHDAFGGDGREHLFRQAPAFRAEQQRIALRKPDGEHMARSAGGEREQPARPDAIQAAGQVRMFFEAREFTVIEPGAPQAGLIESKAQGMNEMQASARVGAQTDDVARVGWDFGLEQNDVQDRFGPRRPA